MPSQRAVNWAKFRVTMVAICALCILGVLFYLLTGGTLLEAKTTLRLFIPDATGIGRNSPVRVNGIDVGKVREVRLTGSTDPNRIVEVIMRVEQDRLRSIPVDSTAQINADTMIGDQFIDISSGRQAAFIQPNSEIRYQPPTDIMKTLDITQFQKQLRIVDAMLTEIEAGRGQVGELVMGDQLYEDVRVSLRRLERDITSAAASTSQVGNALYSEEAYRRIAAPIQRFDQLLAQVQAGQGTAGRMLRDQGDYEQLLKSVADLRKSMADMAATPMMASDKMYEDANRTVAGLIESVDRFNATPAMTTTSLYDSLNGTAREARELVRDLRQDPQKYLRLKLF